MDPDTPLPPRRAHSIWHAIAFEAGLLVVALALGWVLDLDPLATLELDRNGLAIGVVATVPPVATLWLLLVMPWEPLRRLHRLVDDVMGPMFRRATTPQIVALALVAGVAEEALFRGLIQEGLTGWLGPAAALAVASVLFGLAHWVTRLYGILAALVGCYLGGLYLVTGNLLVPIVVHALYDVVALQYLRGAESKN